MQSHTGVQVMVVVLAGHVRHGERYRCAVGDGHCEGHRGVRVVFACDCICAENETTAIFSK